jgi:hypothetical protein
LKDQFLLVKKGPPELQDLAKSARFQICMRDAVVGSVQ